jgi:hypothetical protein
VATDLAKQVVGFRDELHVGVLDAVVDHLDEVTSTVGAHVGDAGLTLRDGGDGCQDRTEGLVGLSGSTRHDARAVEGTLFASGNTGTHEVDSVFADRLLPANGVREQRVAAIDDDVAGLEQVGELADDSVRALTRLDHDDGGAWLLEGSDEFLNRL